MIQARLANGGNYGKTKKKIKREKNISDYFSSSYRISISNCRSRSKIISGSLTFLYDTPRNTKVITRHIWAKAIEICEEIHHQRASKDLYRKRKETIERIFGTAKEFHGLRYTNQIGIEKMHMKIGLTFA